MVHNFNDVGILVQTSLGLVEDLGVSNHSLVVKAFAAQALKHWAKESQVQIEPLLQVIGELLPGAENVKDHCLNVALINVSIN